MKICLLLLGAVSVSTLAANLMANEPSQPSPDRATKLKANVATFALYLNFVPAKGGANRFSLALSVPPLAFKKNDQFGLHAQISQQQAREIIDHLLNDGFLQEAQDVSNGQDASRVALGPSYILTIVAPSQAARFTLTSELGWSANMLARLDALAKVLEGDAADRMHTLLAGLDDQRKDWEKRQQAR